MKNKVFLLIVTLTITFSGFCSALSDFEKIKERVVKELMKTEVEDARIEKLVNTIRDDGTWPGINYKDVSRTGFEHRIHSSNMVALARAYKSKSSKFYKSKKVKATIERALKNWVDNDYFCDNWWHNQIGTPTSLVSLMLIIGDELPKDLVDKAQPIIGRANLNASGARPSGDRIKIAGILAKNLLFINNVKRFSEVVKVIEGELKFATGRGLQYDFSFHHRKDKVDNTISYGTGYANAFVEWAVYTAGTKYAFSAEKIKLLVDYYLDGICKHLVFGKYPDPGTKNRSISREGSLRAWNWKIPEELLLATNYRKPELEEIINVRKGIQKSTRSFATFFWQSEQFFFQRPDFFASVRMFSSRNHNMEEPYNSEGLLNHHRGDGANHISVTGDEYYDIWPVYDYQKIPGATIMQKSELPAPDQIQKLGETDFVGAVTDGIYGAAAFDFKSPHDPLVARKAWFFFDDEYVSLGAGISCKQQNPVVTTLNQCLLRGNVTVSSGNNSSVIQHGEKELESVDWVFHDGIGYVFPNPATVQLKNSAATGSWWKISKQSSTPKDEISLDIFKLWVNHGERPSDETYEYIVVPAATVEKMKQNNSKNNIRILSNTPKVQAVINTKLGICQAVFYQAGEIQVSENLNLISDNPGIIMLKMDGKKVTGISVADPNRELGKFHFSFSAKTEKHGDNFSAVWNEREGITNVSVELPEGNYAGDSVTIEL